ncbi:bZIP transcription factor [Aspergillus undulatus]|uniref:bZIP transcription factor n=1 Tax=Aspergillus undulatus TaxID=1810928 RepID=UPI003CCDE572
MPPRSRAVSQQDASTGQEKRKPVRRDPEKRRQQNVAAQKRYREKLRERLERLEALAESVQQGRGMPAAGPDSSKPVKVQGPSTSPSDNAAADIPIPHISDVSAGSTIPSIGVDYPQPVPQLADIPLDLSLWDSSIYADPLPDDPSMLNLWNPTLPLQPDDTIWYPTATDPSDSATSEGSIWGPTTPISQTTASPDPSVSKSTLLPSKCRSLTKDDDRPGLCWTTTIQCGCSRPHFQVQTDQPGNFSTGNVKILSLQPGTYSDPYANNLRIDQICNITAIWEIGAHVGINEIILCDDDALSPFFQPNTESADALTKANMVSATQAAFKTIKYDLRPTKEQITISHHPFIDIFPFPTLRRNLITHQGEYDEDAFFHDTLTGLVCWGGTNVGKKDRNANTGMASTGTPWDYRSWEAQAWFVKKWWSLLGGEDGELVRQTDWWRSIRGEDALVVEV